MRPLATVFVCWIMTCSNVACDNYQNYDFTRTPTGRTDASKQETEAEDDSQESYNSLIEEKLMHQNQALEHLITAVDTNGNMIRRLVENLSRGLERPTMPTKAEARELPPNMQNARSGHQEHPILRLGKNIPKYGKLAKDLIMKDVYSGTDPTPLVEEATIDPLLRPGSRRSFGDDPVSDSRRNGDSGSIWCPLALLCKRTVNPICGFDDEFGYGKFEDYCHLLRVNCYWKFNFSVVYSCRPKL